MLVTCSFSLACSAKVIRQQGFHRQTRRLNSAMSGTTTFTNYAVDIGQECLLTKHAPQLGIIVNVARVEIVSDSAFEQSRILRDNC